MTDDYTIIVSAFVDGEPVDPDRLAVALEVPDARAALVDFVRMRALVRAGDPPLPPPLHALRHPAVASRLLRWPAVAAVLLLVFLAGLMVPRPGGRTTTGGETPPPVPSRIERFTPGVDWHQTN